MWMFLQLRNHENHLHLFLKPDSNVNLGVEESYGAKGENAKHSKSCPVDIPVMITVMVSVRVMANLGQLTTYLGMGAVAIIMMVSVKVVVIISNIGDYSVVVVVVVVVVGVVGVGDGDIGDDRAPRI